MSGMRKGQEDAMDNATDWHEEVNAEIVGLAQGVLCAGGYTPGHGGDDG